MESEFQVGSAGTSEQVEKLLNAELKSAKQRILELDEKLIAAQLQILKQNGLLSDIAEHTALQQTIVDMIEKREKKLKESLEKERKANEYIEKAYDRLEDFVRDTGKEITGLMEDLTSSFEQQLNRYEKTGRRADFQEAFRVQVDFISGFVRAKFENEILKKGQMTVDGVDQPVVSSASSVNLHLEKNDSGAIVTNLNLVKNGEFDFAEVESSQGLLTELSTGSVLLSNPESSSSASMEPESNDVSITTLEVARNKEIEFNQVESGQGLLTEFSTGSVQLCNTESSSSASVEPSEEDAIITTLGAMKNEEVEFPEVEEGLLTESSSDLELSNPESSSTRMEPNEDDAVIITTLDALKNEQSGFSGFHEAETGLLTESSTDYEQLCNPEPSSLKKHTLPISESGEPSHTQNQSSVEICIVDSIVSASTSNYLRDGLVESRASQVLPESDPGHVNGFALLTLDSLSKDNPDSEERHTEDTSKWSYRRFHCKCGFCCITKNNLMGHINLMNSKYKCEICQRKFGFSDYLKRHLSKMHNSNDNWTQSTVGSRVVDESRQRPQRKLVE